MFFQRKQESELEGKLRRHRPRAEEGLVDEIVSRIEGDGPALQPHSLRVGFAVASVAIVAALAAFGGVTYAASGVQHAARAVKHVFVAKQAPQAKTPSPDVLGALQPGKTSAADQYLPPGVTPVAALTAFAQFVIKANDDLQSALNCSAKTGSARLACQTRLRALQALEARNRASLDALVTKLGALPADKQAQAGTLMAIHIQQQQRLAAGQATRRTNCAGAAFRSAHRALCARANPVTEATERLRLGELQLAELETLLAGL